MYGLSYTEYNGWFCPITCIPHLLVQLKLPLGPHSASLLADSGNADLDSPLFG